MAKELSRCVRFTALTWLKLKRIGAKQSPALNRAQVIEVLADKALKSISENKAPLTEIFK